MKIGEIADLTRVSTKTIRYYEEIGLLPEPERESNGYRYYGAETVRQLQFVHYAQTAGLTLGEIRQVLEIRSQGRAPCVHVRELLNRHLEQVNLQIAELKTARRELKELAIRAESTDPADCSEDVICSILIQTK